VEALEPDQFVYDRDRWLPRRRLGRRAQAGLWALRLLVPAVSTLVVYTFVVSVAKPG